MRQLRVGELWPVQPASALEQPLGCPVLYCVLYAGAPITAAAASESQLCSSRRVLRFRIRCPPPVRYRIGNRASKGLYAHSTYRVSRRVIIYYGVSPRPAYSVILELGFSPSRIGIPSESSSPGPARPSRNELDFSTVDQCFNRSSRAGSTAPIWSRGRMRDGPSSRPRPSTQRATMAAVEAGPRTRPDRPPCAPPAPAAPPFGIPQSAPQTPSPYAKAFHWRRRSGARASTPCGGAARGAALRRARHLRPLAAAVATPEAPVVIERRRAS